MEEKDTDDLEKYLWTEYDGEDIILDEVEITEEEGKRMDEFVARVIKEAKESQKKWKPTRKWHL